MSAADAANTADGAAPPPGIAARLRAALEREGRGRHGVQLALAVVLAYAASSALRLPESFWAVMSALIVVRPTSGATFSAGWLRLGGTLLGTLGGLAAVWLHHHGASGPAITLAVVSALAFASALLPMFASAPIASLIILSSGAIAGHTALEVAELRGIEVGLGVLVGIAVSLVLRGAGATARFEAEAALLLRRYAAALRIAAAGAPPGAEADNTTRTHLRALAALSLGADTEARVLRRRAASAPFDPERHRKLARLLARVQQDCALLVRAYAVTSDPQGMAVAVALECVADSWSQRRRIDARALDALGTADPLATGALRFLVDDLKLLARAGNARLAGA